MKTKLLKKWRKEAWNRIGLFKQDDGKYRVVFDKSGWGLVYEYENCPESKSFQVVCRDIEDPDEAKSRCDEIRRIFILREARKEYRKKKYGAGNRVY